MLGPSGSDLGAVECRQLLHDISEAENVLLRHAEQTCQPDEHFSSPSQTAIRLISLLRTEQVLDRQRRHISMHLLKKPNLVRKPVH